MEKRGEDLVDRKLLPGSINELVEGSISSQNNKMIENMANKDTSNIGVPG